MVALSDKIFSILDFYFYYLSFRGKTVGGGQTARNHNFVHKLLVVMVYSESLLFLFKFSIKTVGGGPTCLSLDP